MAHPEDTNYIIEVLADGWDRPVSYNGGSNDQSLIYSAIDNKTSTTAEDAGYVTVHIYPSWITDHCPNAPDASSSEIKSLVRTYGSSGSAWLPVSEELE